MPYLIDLSSNNLKESKSTVIFIANGDSGNIEASFDSRLGYQETKLLREKLLQTTEKEFFNKASKAYSFDVKIENGEISNQKNYDEPISIKYDMKFSLGSEDLIYFNPLLAEANKENIFKAEKRIYPVEMPYAIDETYILDMEIPKGYIVDEIPKSVRSKFNDNEGVFEYIIVNKEGHIQLRCKFQLYKANFEATDYESLRDFFGLVVKKQAEQIVFKKLK
jgi:bifunctional DNA-binding transcriptional regulator/antitoxin component of YhaV-PrlF toxin-antitoxin module